MPIVYILLYIFNGKFNLILYFFSKSIGLKKLHQFPYFLRIQKTDIILTYVLQKVCRGLNVDHKNTFLLRSKYIDDYLYSPLYYH